jgi:hypothetical protein
MREYAGNLTQHEGETQMQNETEGPRFTLSPELTAAVANVETLTGERAKIETALTKARTDAGTAAGELEAARARLADVESGAALDGAAVDPKARKAVGQARETAEAMEARTRGLGGRLQINAAAIAEAQGELQRAWQAWKADVAEAVFTELKEAAEVFRSKLQIAAAIGTALDISRAIGAFRDAVFIDPFNSRVNLLNQARYPWKDNPAAVELYDELAVLHAPLARHLTAPAVTVTEPAEAAHV